MTEPLDPLRLPLAGSRLVEASAGTGKTWTIAALYLRLVLGHGEGIGRPLAPSEILVMTFTKAATRELSDRIRARLVEAAALFRRAPAAGDDAFLAALRDDHAAGAPRDAAARRLADAADAMDDAAVHTIDAWCQRMLREHAFDSGCLFDEELQPNETPLLRRAAQDWWRQQVYPLQGDALAAVLARWRSVDVLIDELRPLLELPLPLLDDGELGDVLGSAVARHAALLADLKRGWAERAAVLRHWLEREWAHKPKRVAMQAHNARSWLDALDAWAADPPAVMPDLKTGWQRFTREDLLRTAKGPLPDDIPEAFDAIAPLQAALQALPQPGPLLLGHALVRVRRRMQELKAEAGRFGYADMLQRLDDALDVASRDARARQLRERIVAQYPAALIDEFQDTSPRQLSIFDRVWRIADDDAQSLLLLIGDPKQSIYAFRGADIHSYLRARRATAGRHHALDTNRRSTAALAGAVNTLFGRAEARPGGGAFLFAGGLPFEPVRAQGRPERLQRGGADVPALTVCLDIELSGATDHRTRFAALCAERIVGLLADASAGFVEEGRAMQRLRPGDIAVLVRTGTDAEAVQRALRQRGVASVYLSDKDSVWQRDEAVDLLRLLQAVAEPRRPGLARAALATPLFGRTLPELLRLAHDDVAFDAECEHLRTLHAVWQAQGVLAMLRRALHLFRIPARLLAETDANRGEGERRLTNLLHLAELLQAASATVEGEPALVRWLQGQIEAAAGDVTPAEDQVLRLESDADLVQVVTVHKSKGLEYPVVFVPFACAFRAADGRKLLRRDGSDGRRELVLAPTADDREAAEQERLQEDLRLLYVALTRARHALWVGAAALDVRGIPGCAWHRSAFGYLVSGSDALTPGQVAPALQALAQADASIVIEPAAADPVPLTRWTSGAAPEPLPPARRYDATFDRRWAIASYSALVRDAATVPSEPIPAHVLRDDDDEAPALVLLEDATPRAGQPWHRFPRGTFAGSFLHDQLEWLAGEGFGALAEAPAVQQMLVRRCERQGWGDRSADVAAWLQRAVTAPLPPLGASLASVEGRLLPEMEFWLPVERLDAAALDALCRDHIAAGAPRPALTPRVLHGLLMGFADLVFEHGGRHWVLDYKSNALGTADADYDAGALQQAMLAHRYDVQAALYLAALHRLLRARLGAARYAPERDLGGALWFFLRGIGHPGAGCHVVQPPLALLQAIDAMLGPPR